MTQWKKARLALIPSAVLAAAGSAHAALPTGVEGAITTMQADAVTVGGLILVALVAIMAFKFIKKAF